MMGKLKLRAHGSCNVAVDIFGMQFWACFLFVVKLQIFPFRFLCLDYVQCYMQYNFSLDNAFKVCFSIEGFS